MYVLPIHILFYTLYVGIRYRFKIYWTFSEVLLLIVLQYCLFKGIFLNKFLLILIIKSHKTFEFTLQLNLINFLLTFEI